MWTAPTFQTPSPLPPCNDDICPQYDGETCTDAEGVIYGVLCRTRLSGIIIVDSGKYLKERSYTGNFEGCTGFCDTYNKTYCVGVSFEAGSCQAMDAITGNFPGPGMAALRLS